MKISLTTETPIHIDRIKRTSSFTMPEDHMHPYCEFYYVLQGNSRFFVNDTFYSLKQGDIMFIASNALHHTFYPNKNNICERFVVYFTPHSLSSNLALDPNEILNFLSSSHKISILPSHTQSLELLLNQMLNESKFQDSYSYGLLHSYLETLLLLTLRHQDSFPLEEDLLSDTDINLQTAARYICENYNKNITLEETAAIACLSPTYFSRKFKAVTGLGFKEYLNYIRIKEASEALITSSSSITDIALNCGFSDGNYFKDVFKKFHGVSPRQFRKQ